jgi:NAD(P)-dependent dehydrogenase (short-subunit alcohol dehydrogenase family)
LEKMKRRKDDTSIGTTPEEVDVRDWVELDDFVSDNEPFDNIVFAAGVNRLDKLMNMTRPNMEYIFDVNAYGFINLMSSISARYDKCNVVAITSDAAVIPMRHSIAYCSSKAALEMSIRVAARELAPMFRVNGVRPGPVYGTGMTKDVEMDVERIRGWSVHEQQLKTFESVPIGRYVNPNEVCVVIQHVLDGPIAQTGSIVAVNGGR